MIVEHSDAESKTWNSASTSSTKMINDNCHYSVSVTLDIPYTLYFCLVQYSEQSLWYECL